VNNFLYFREYYQTEVVLKRTSFIFIFFIAVIACSRQENKTTDTESKEQELRELKMRLNAAEAQLLNAKTELAKYQKDSIIQQDSL
jgi:hypothetical protein